LYIYLDIKTKATRTNALPLPNDKGQMTNDDPNELALFVPTYLYLRFDDYCQSSSNVSSLA
jgi:hypothetical protein